MSMLASWQAAFEDRLIVLRQVGPGLRVDEEVELGTAFPPAGVVVELGDLVEAELLVVVRADPFGGVDRALFERRIDVAAGDLLRHDAELLQRQPAGAADAQLEALQVGDRLDLLAEPAAHLRAGVAGAEADDVVVLQEVVVELRGRRRGTSTRSAAGRSCRTGSRSRRRTSGPCRRSSTAPCGSTGPSRSARRRRRRTPARFRRRQRPGSGTCRWSPTRTRSEIVTAPP